MEDHEALERTLKRARRALQILEEESAGYTALTRPAHLQIELEEQRKEVASLEARLAQLSGRGGAAIPDNLPSRPPIFCGRETEVARCLEALSPDVRGWGVTIDGLGGMGKTALALEAAHRAREQAWFDAYAFASAKTARLTPEGVREETLALTSLDAFVREAARVLRCEAAERATDAAERRRLLLEGLRGRRALLLWDNLETLIAEERDLIAEFLTRLPGANKAILTSRRRTGESALTLRLERLDERAAMGLMDALGRRAPRVAAELRAGGEGGRRALYNAAGGNPLVLHFALGLVAQRGYTLPAAVARVLDAERSGDLYGFLFADAARDLQADDRAALSALAGFRSPASLGALRDVTGLAEAPLRLALERLVTLSLVNEAQGDAYGLHPLTRTFVLAALDVGAVGATLAGRPGQAQGLATTLDPDAWRKALRYWVDYAKQYGGDDKDAYLNYPRLEAEWPNLEAAAAALHGLLLPLPQAGEGWGEGQKEAARLLVDLAGALRIFLFFRGYWDERIRLSTWAYEAARALENWRAAGWRAYDVAWIHYYRAETDQAAAWAARMAEAMERSGGRRDRAAAIRLRGAVAQQRQDYPEAKRLYAEALAAFRDLGEEADLAIVLNDLGAVARAQEQYDRAEDYYRETLALAEKHEAKGGQVYITENLGLLALERGRPAQARPHFERALALARQVGREDLVADAHWGLARVLEEEGRPAEALPLAEEALRIRERLRHRAVGEARELAERLRKKVGGRQ